MGGSPHVQTPKPTIRKGFAVSWRPLSFALAALIAVIGA